MFMRDCNPIIYAACPAGTYCLLAMVHVQTVQLTVTVSEEGLIRCTCIDGHYRAPQGEENSPCTSMYLNYYVVFVLNFQFHIAMATFMAACIIWHFM